MRIFYAIRHGQTDWNVQGLLQGTIDTDLNETGRDQARAAHEVFKTLDIHHIIVSPKKRCLQTLEHLLNEQDVPSITDQSLIERSFGQYEGQSRDKVTNGQGMSIPHLPTVEPWDEVKDRAASCVLRHLRETPDKTLCFVTHGGVTSALVEALTGREGFVTPNCQFIRFTEHDQGWDYSVIETHSVETTHPHPINEGLAR